MKIAVLGGGFAGLAASYYLSQKHHEVTLIEKEPVLGGLAVGFKGERWEWYLERAIHHLFTNDYDILNLAKETGFDGIFFKKPVTASLYDRSDDEFEVVPLNTPADLLRFPYLSLPSKIDAGMVMAFLKVSPFLSFYEKTTAERFLRSSMGNEAWNVLWKELFRKKFGKYAGKILASFIWARVKKRTSHLGYIKGGFQEFLSHLERRCRAHHVVIKKQCEVQRIRTTLKQFEIATLQKGKLKKERYDAVVSTLPTPILNRIGRDTLPDSYLNRLSKIRYLHAVSLIIEGEQKLFETAYWVNVVTNKLSAMGFFQQTNFIESSRYHNHEILYAGNYVEREDPLLKMTDQEVFRHYASQISEINSKFNPAKGGTKFYVFKGPFAQPIFDKEFVKNKPNFETPVKKFFIANLDMTYPYDRGTNYAVKVGREVAKLL